MEMDRRVGRNSARRPGTASSDNARRQLLQPKGPIRLCSSFESLLANEQSRPTSGLSCRVSGKCARLLHTPSEAPSRLGQDRFRHLPTGLVRTGPHHQPRTSSDPPHRPPANPASPRKSCPAASRPRHVAHGRWPWLRTAWDLRSLVLPPTPRTTHCRNLTGHDSPEPFAPPTTSLDVSKPWEHPESDSCP